MIPAKDLLDNIHKICAADPRPLRVLNVCGGHERSITMAGLRGVLPDNIKLIPGPGCPVCVCPEEDIYDAIQLALNHKATLVAFGDMLRVPANVPKGAARSLEQAKAAGADVRPIAAPEEAVRLAHAAPDNKVVFFAAGFETTMAPVASLLSRNDLPVNLSFLISGRLTWPAVAHLLADEEPRGFDALIAPGHVATIMGPEEWRFVTDRYSLPAAVAGFEPESLLAALTSILEQRRNNRPDLANCYPGVVRPNGNPTARALLQKVFTIADANWRGIGVLPDSGFHLNQSHAHLDARLAFGLESDPARKRMGQMPPGCSCASVVLGKITPPECPLYGLACVPRSPIGPCMVSDEGACRIWWASGVRENASKARRNTSNQTAA